MLKNKVKVRHSYSYYEVFWLFCPIFYINPAIHIGFLDYTLFKENPEFYASYKIMNVKNHMIYSDNFDLRVVDLTQIHLATEEDKQYQLDYWASLFKSKTWEKLKMTAEKNEYMQEASKTIFQLSADELVRKRCRDREEYYDDIRSYQHALAKQEQELKEKDKELQENRKVLQENKKELQERDSENARLRQKLIEAGIDPED